ncbi:MAG: hypothetical protein HQK60_11855 [Deltaproteobacteria bacterium]|nr:hypothetical protein [Deltaproteobacteria bacterium]
MQVPNTVYLTSLKQLVAEHGQERLFPCIEDLAANGLSPERFSPQEPQPSRQDITQYLSAWFKHIGFLPDDCQSWLIDYCLGMLSAISSSSASQIRHSTKSNIKYIYGRDIPFYCGREDNPRKAQCRPDCPAYQDMAVPPERAELRKPVPKGISARTEQAEDSIIQEPQTVPIPVGLKYREQFQKAMTTAVELIQQGKPKKIVVKALNDQGFKTRTGRAWTYSNFQAELAKYFRELDEPTEESGNDSGVSLVSGSFDTDEATPPPPEPGPGPSGPASQTAAQTAVAAGARPPILGQKAPKPNDYRLQVTEALDLAAELLKQGIPKTKLVRMLNQRGFRTKTGKEWSYPNLQAELNKYYARLDGEEASD